ncbi:HAD family hydrolase [Bacillaceae bacterium SIJ1]|uniref:HAD family hydrolase n=1 Tax=Litoribacterium kuwaitense TaxID=1398745 RepID=UPI0013EBFB4A|nr:HAD family hydrolase [Litoribacterium kuwaitense]NGP46395.1 HAD family hydrolase [Litoribacterium kuwaitense]
MYKYVIFDVDGTMIDTEVAILKALQMTLNEEEGKEYTIDDLRFTFGLTSLEALKQLHVRDPERVEDIWQKKVLDFVHEVKVFPGIEKVLQQLTKHGVKLGIVTSKTRQEYNDEFVPFGLAPYFTYTVCVDETSKHKPDPEPMFACLKGLAAKPEETLYIGDTVHDLNCAKASSVAFGLASWGAHDDDFEASEYIFEKPEDILHLWRNKND